jgi:hypothetical protein
MERGTPLQNFFLHISLQVPGKWAPHHVPQQGPHGERSIISRANGLFIRSFIYICQSPQYGGPPSKKNGSIFGHRPRSPAWTEGLHTMGCGLVPQGDRLRHCNLYTVPCSLQLVILHLGLGETRVPLASVCRSNRDQGMPCTTVTASHVTQGRVEYESTIPRGTEGVLDLWEALDGITVLFIRGIWIGGAFCILQPTVLY